jgi:outer membrane protein TolC
LGKKSILLCCFCLLCLSNASHAQQSQSLTINQAIDLALANYPSIRASEAQAKAAAGGINVARTAYLPRTDLLWQENRATRNNVFGLLLPQSVIPPISGPVLGTNSLTSAWGSAGGALLSWEPFDFGLRKANVELAHAVSQQANASVTVTQLDVATTAGDAFLAASSAQQAVKAAEANVERMQTFAKAVQVLVDNELRAGADASRADAELAGARIQLIQAQQAAEIARINLAEAIGQAGVALTLDAGSLLVLPQDTVIQPPKIEAHPLAVAQAAFIDIVRARKHILDRSYFPRFNFQSAFFARGSGALVNGQIDETKGLFPQTVNWASGITISFPVFDIFSLRAKRTVETNNEIAEKSRYDQTIQSLKAQTARAQALIDAARRIAETTPVQLQAARDAEFRVRARYDAQLATVTEVAEAQRLLAQAEIDDAVAHINVWRALLVAAKAQGDLKPFLQQALNAPIKRKE